MPLGAPATLICAATGTGLSTIVGRISDGLVLDLENEICQSYAGVAALAIDQDEIPTMDQVARRPRAELHDRWSSTASAAANRIANFGGSGPRVLAMHLSWYNSSTSEFFSPVVSDPLSVGEFGRVIVLIDDVYDMVARLEDGEGIFAERSQQIRARQLRKLGYKGVRQDDGSWQLSDEESALVDRHALARARFAAFAHLLSWRRAEMIRAETLAHELGAELHLLATKHTFRSLELLIQEPSVSSVYLSHRITEPRLANKASAELPDELGPWSVVAHEINQLHEGAVNEGLVLVCPTAIDELRFADPTSPGTSPAYLSARWPLPECIEDTAWSPVADPEHTHFFRPDGLDAEDPVLSGIVRSAADQIFFEIAYRDHYIVEHVQSLLVFRPFYSDDLSQIENIDWSGGVKPEIQHWQSKAIPELVAGGKEQDQRRVAFVHSTDEIRARLKWLKSGQFEDRFVLVLKSHLTQKLLAESFPLDEVTALLRGEIAPVGGSHLDVNPQHYTSSRPASVISWIESFGRAAIHEVFSMFQRPHQPGYGPGQFEIAFLSRPEQGDRSLEDLGGAVREASAFFRGDVGGVEVSQHFNEVVSREFNDVFGISIDDAAFDAIGMDRQILLDLNARRG